MFKYFKIISIILFMTVAASAMPLLAGPVGVVEDNKSSWYAVIRMGDKDKRLYVKGDIFSSDENPARSLRISDIRKDALVLEDVASKNEITVKPGEQIPIDGSGMTFEKTVESSVLEYNYNKADKKVTKNQLEDFTIKNLEKKKIVLEKDYSGSPLPGQLSGRESEIFNSPKDANADKKVILLELFNKIESEKIGDDVWALNRGSADSALSNAGAVLISVIKKVEPRYRFGEGPSLKFDTDLGTVVVNKDGFLIQNIAAARLTENFGIEQGDVIKSMNGYPVNSLFGLYRIYENIASDKNTRLLSVDIVRGGKMKTLIYKIR